jgi:hypothetical protein
VPKQGGQLLAYATIHEVMAYARIVNVNLEWDADGSHDRDANVSGRRPAHSRYVGMTFAQSREQLLQGGDGEVIPTSTLRIHRRRSNRQSCIGNLENLRNMHMLALQSCLQT